jgi:hypothetical protein
MRCIECGREKDSAEPGWVTVLAAERAHYCPECMANLVRLMAGLERDGRRAGDA